MACQKRTTESEGSTLQPTSHTRSNSKTAFPELGVTVTLDAAPQRTDISVAIHCLLRQTETIIPAGFSFDQH